MKIVPEDFILTKENKKDFKKSTISRINLTNEFTLEDIEAHQKHLKKNRHEVQAQVRLTSAVIRNVEENHPFVAAMSDEQLATAAYLQENKEVLKKAEAKLKEVDKTVKKYNEYLDVIYKKFGFVPTELPQNDSNQTN